MNRPRYSYEDIGSAFDAMANLRLGPSGLKHFLYCVFPDTADRKNEEALQEARNNRLRARHFFWHEKGTDLPGVRRTL